MTDNSKRTGAAIEAHYQRNCWVALRLTQPTKRCPKDNVRCFRNRLRGLRDQ